MTPFMGGTVMPLMDAEFTEAFSEGPPPSASLLSTFIVSVDGEDMVATRCAGRSRSAMAIAETPTSSEF